MLILLIFAVFLSVADTTLNKLFAVFVIYYGNIISGWCNLQTWDRLQNGEDRQQKRTKKHTLPHLWLQKLF